MFFGDSKDLEVNEVGDFYLASKPEDLPNIVCFLDRGVIVHSKFLRTGDGRLIATEYHVDPGLDTTADGENYWMFVDWSENPERNLMFLHVLLSQHIDSCHLSTPNLSHYFLQYIGIGIKGGVFTP
jgi:hypothetical protein